MPIGVGVDVSVRRGLDVVVLNARRRFVERPLARQTPTGRPRPIPERSDRSEPEGGTGTAVVADPLQTQ